MLSTDNWDEFKQEVKRVDWDEYFILQAYLISIRSLDSQTQCGCVLTNDNTIISAGYNSFISNIDDSILPNLRPKKYDFMIHSEHNAVLNCAKNGKSTKGCTAYVTGPPCIHCLQYMHQAGIVEIVYYDGNKAHMTQNEEYDKNFEILSNLSQVKIRVIKNSPQLNEKIAKIKGCK